MTRTNFISTIILFFTGSTLAQKPADLQFSFQWQAATQKSGYTELVFEGCGLDAARGGIPYATESFFSSKEIYGYQCKLIPGSAEYLPGVADPGIVSLLASEYSVSCHVTEGRNQKFGVVSVVPLRLDPLSGKVERLLDCRVELQPLAGSAVKKKTLSFAENSVLAEGTWYKISIGKDGIYKIDKELLTELGIDTQTLNPQQLNIYGNGGELLPLDNSEPRPDDLLPNAIFVSTSGTVFHDDDYILFFGKGSDTWKQNDSLKRFEHQKHFYSDSAYYYIRTDDVTAFRVQSISSSPMPETHTVTEFQDYQYLENDLHNLVKSGREFYGEEYDLNTSATYTFSFPNITNDVATLEVKVAARSLGIPSSYTITAGGQVLELEPPATSDSATSPVAREDSGELTFTPSNSVITVNLDFIKSNAEAVGWLDYLRLNATRKLQMSGNQLMFRDTLSVGPYNVSLFQILQSPASLQVWDITNQYAPVLIQHTMNGSTAEFKLASDELRQFIAFTSAGFLIPEAIGMVGNQNLHALENIDLMIVSAPRLLGAAEELAAIHQAEGMTVALATAPQVFNEFSSGNPDVTAIKMLMKMLYDRAEGDVEKMPDNLLLFGDGSIYNKGTAANAGNNVITFQSSNSLYPSFSYVSDDYFVLLSDDDGENIFDQLDCGVGRIPASDISEAFDYVDKVKQYMAENTSAGGGASCLGDDTQSPYGPWRNTIVFVSDDQDGNGGASEDDHMIHAEEHSDKIRSDYNDYDVVKIYMDAYQQESTPGGERYPEGAEAIRQRIQNGALLVTYVGHGGERGWAHERILDISTIQNWTNINRLPVFLTATCELSRYDDDEFSSAGEELLMNAHGGAIAMLTTTRIVYSGSNLKLGRGFFSYALESESIPGITLGEINRLTKNWPQLDNDSGKRNFSLLGDPALKMSYPKQEVYTTIINGHDISSYTDTLHALQEVEIAGFVGDSNGNILGGFNGFVYPTLFDKATHITTLNNDGGQNGAGVYFQYDVFNRIIYKGKASVNNGQFSFRFVVPYDINFSIDTARVSYYAVAGNVDAHGHSEEFLIGGTLAGAQLNTVGPELDLFINDTTFVDGGITHQNPMLLARLRDENGINTVGNGIGHDLQAILDGDNQNPIVLNDYYEADLDTYKSGQIRYQLNNLADGPHHLRVKVWDIHNNSSDGEIEFVVAPSAQLALDHVLNYPNPFTTYTNFYFGHNQACSNLDVRIQVFTVSGKLVKTIEQNVHTDGFRSQPIAWDGRDDFGDNIGRGVYVYRVEVRTELGEKAEQFEKLVILK